MGRRLHFVHMAKNYRLKDEMTDLKVKRPLYLVTFEKRPVFVLLLRNKTYKTDMVMSKRPRSPYFSFGRYLQPHKNGFAIKVFVMRQTACLFVNQSATDD